MDCQIFKNEDLSYCKTILLYLASHSVQKFKVKFKIKTAGVTLSNREAAKKSSLFNGSAIKKKTLFLSAKFRLTTSSRGGGVA